jgi:hypothetical protein
MRLVKFEGSDYMFTDGKTQQYEALMQQTPNRNPKHSGKRNSDFKYKYVDVDCDYCLYCRKCKFGICPYIVEFIDDLLQDEAFIRAIANAETCESGHRKTLIHIKQKGLDSLKSLCH